MSAKREEADKRRNAIQVQALYLARNKTHAELLELNPFAETATDRQIMRLALAFKREAEKGEKI